MTSGAGSTTGTRRRGVRRREPAGKPGGDGPAGGGHRGGREAEGFRRSKEGGGNWERKGGTRPNFGRNSDVFDGFSWTALPLASDGHTNKKMMGMLGFGLGGQHTAGRTECTYQVQLLMSGLPRTSLLIRPILAFSLAPVCKPRLFSFGLECAVLRRACDEPFVCVLCRPPPFGVRFWTRGQCCLT